MKRESIAPILPTSVDASLSPTPTSDDTFSKEADALLALNKSTGDNFTLTRTIEDLLLVIFALIPLLAISYLQYFQNPSPRIANVAFHEIAIAVAIAESAFISYVTWRCYLSSGEPFLRWLTLAFLSFTVIYAPHGMFTRLAEDHMWLFLFYGPVSRFAMAACLFVGLLVYGAPPDSEDKRKAPAFWGGWIAVFLGINLLIGIVTHLWPGAMPVLRLVMEYGALTLAALGIAFMLARRQPSPLMLLCALALAYFAQSSLAFVLATPWDHQWWLAHAISAGGFLLLSYGVLHAYHTTRSFSLVFGHDQLIDALRAAKANADDAARQLRLANSDLARLAATDPLTGVANRRHFIERTEAELARSGRSSTPLSLLALDLDHFKRVNDSFGHETGDRVLQHFCRTVADTLRPSDLLGRLGGEEFMVLLPGAEREEGLRIAERIRSAVAARSADNGLPAITTSIGLATYDSDDGTQDGLFRIADDRLYRAKHLGRDRVVGFDTKTTDDDEPAPAA